MVDGASETADVTLHDERTAGGVVVLKGAGTRQRAC